MNSVQGESRVNPDISNLNPRWIQRDHEKLYFDIKFKNSYTIFELNISFLLGPFYYE